MKSENNPLEFTNAIFMNTTTAMGICKDGQWIMCNNSLLSIIKFTNNETIVGTQVIDIASTSHKKYFEKFLQQDFTQKNAKYECEIMAQATDKSELNIKVNLSVFEYENTAYHHLTIINYGGLDLQSQASCTINNEKEKGDKKSKEEIKNIFHKTDEQLKIIKNKTLDPKLPIKNIEKNNSIQNNQIEKSINIQNNFLSMITHDLKNSLNGIIGLSKIIINNNHLYTKEKLIYFSGLIYDETKSSYQLLENLQAWSNEHEGVIEFKPTELHLKTLVNDLVSEIAGSIKFKTIEVEDNIEDKIYVTADKNMLQTIIRNLLSNSIKHTNAGGKISLSAIETKHTLEIKVSDTGTGMTDETLQNLFTSPIKSATNKLKSVTKSGIGLLICKELVELHNGEIWAESLLGKGSTFIFTIGKNNY